MLAPCVRFQLDHGQTAPGAPSRPSAKSTGDEPTALRRAMGKNEKKKLGAGKKLRRRAAAVERNAQVILDAEPRPPWVKTSVASAIVVDQPGDKPVSVTSGTLAAVDINRVPEESKPSPTIASSTSTPQGGGVWPGSREVVSTPLAWGEVLRGEFSLNRPKGTFEVHTTGAPCWALWRRHWVSE